MKRVLTKSLNIALTLLFFANIANAIEAEYKNSLTKVEFIKAGDSSYNINLHTQKNYLEPVKIIKKSDLNYYILLPETNNLSSIQSVSNGDIRSAKVQVFPYAGADIKNGYTKIDINTSRPINFAVTTKSATGAKITQPNTIAQKPQQQTLEPVKKAETKVETKTLPQPKQESKAPEKKIEPAQTKPIKSKQIEEVKELKEIKQFKEPVVLKNNLPVFEPDMEVPTKQILPEKEEPIVKEQEVEQEPIEQVVKEAISQEPLQYDDSFLGKVKAKIAPYKNKLQSKAALYGLSLYDVLLMGLAAFITFIIMLVLLTRKPKQQAKLKNKSELVDKNQAQSKEAKGQYFVFDNKVANLNSTKQKKSFELSSYDPRQNANYAYRDENDEAQESDIIQKILKEDSYSKIAPDEFSNTYNQQVPVMPQPVVSQPVFETQEYKTDIIEESQDEPIVLSSIEIAPQRGFMCISYKNNISFVGYIVDDVFALYNFKQSELSDYHIKFRLSEKTETGANFIVKIDKTKLLVAVTKSSMSLEVAM